MNNVNEYMTEAGKTAVYPHYGDKDIRELYYLAGLLTEEAGEALGVINKAYRNGKSFLSDDDISKINKELGDVMWAWSQLCYACSLWPSAVLRDNLTKLADRQRRQVLDGAGDDR